jgi:DNA topoisomerase-2
MSAVDEVRIIKNLSQKDQAKLKSVTMYLGSTQVGTYSMYLYDKSKNRFIMEDIQYAPAWYKIVDEIIVNAIDHWVHFPKSVKTINIEFNQETGEIYIQNGGPSIGITKTKTHDGREIWVAQMALTDFNSSSNYEENKKRYSGGCNGLGSKLTALYSDWFIVDTVDAKKKKRYTQKYRNRLDIIEEPTITATDIKPDYTAIRFMPAYKLFGYDKGYTKEIGAALFKLIEMRGYQAAVYTDAKIKVNGRDLTFTGDRFSEYARMHLYTADTVLLDDDTKSETSGMSEPSGTSGTSGTSGMSEPSGSSATDELNTLNRESPPLYITKLCHIDGEPDWDICIGISDGKFQHVSVINGLYINGGNYIKAIQNQIVEALQPKVEKILKSAKVKFNKNMIINSLFLFIRGKMANPEFDSQTKSKIMNPLESFAAYRFKEKDWKHIWGLLGQHIEATFLNKTKIENKRVVRGEVNVPKYEGAQLAGSKQSGSCILWIAEGDSACGTIKEGITHRCSKLSFKNCGTFNIGGVPMNCRTKCTEKINPQTKERVIVQSDAFRNNERLTSLVKVLGLCYGKTYDPDTEEGRKEIATLRYGKVIIAVDQDTDGFGIFGLLLNFFEYFWPKLIVARFVNKFNTPIIRAFTLRGGNIDRKAKVREFYAMNQFKEFIDKEFEGNEERAQSKYFIKYYKGLGSHENADIPAMFAEYEAQLLSAALDKAADHMLSIYYGKDADARKDILRTPASEVVMMHTMAITNILNSMVKEFHRDKIARSLPHTIDGMTESRRKVLWAARDKFGQSMTIKNQIKVAALAAYTTQLTAYMHGEQCLCDTIILMAQTFTGSNHLPMLLPRGHFGSRSFGGKDAASPRYIYTQLNSELCYAMYPADDDYLLKFVFDEGQRCEPKYMVPILPMAVLENLQGNIGVGWSAQLWARDIDEVFKNVRGLINGTIKKSKSMRPWLLHNKGELRNVGGKIYSVGNYEFDEKKNTIHIDELPLGICPRVFLGTDKDRATKTEAATKSKSASKSIKGANAIDKSNSAESLVTKTKQPLWAKSEFAKRPLCQSSNERIDITLYLRPGEYENITQKYGNAEFDPIEDFLGLRSALNSNINCIGADDTVQEFTKYEEVVDAWFIERKQLYELRIRRQIIILKLYIKYLENIIRFMDKEATYKWTTKTDIDIMRMKLSEEKYDRINESLLRAPKYTPTDELEHLILFANGATYHYLLSLSNIDKSAGNSKKRKELLEAKKLELIQLEQSIKKDKFIGASVWLAELDELETIIRRGTKCQWTL